MNEELDARIKAIKPSKGFTVKTETERQAILVRAKQLKEFGQIAFDVVTKSDGNGGFKVAAI